jgi:ribose transport system substrate-binding protein
MHVEYGNGRDSGTFVEGAPSRRRRRYVVSSLTAAVAVLSVAACTSATPSVNTTTTSASGQYQARIVPKSEIKIAIIPGGPNVYFAPWGLAAQALSKQLGVTVSAVVAPTSSYDPTIEVSTIDALVAKGYNAFAVFPDGESAIIPTYQQLIDKGIPVFDLAGCTTDPTPALLCYATNVEASANYETQVLEKAMGGRGSIAFLTGLLTDANTALRAAGVHEAVAASDGKLKLAQTVSNIDSPVTAPPAVQDMLMSKGDSLTGMLSTDYYPSVAASSILSNDPRFRHILFIGQDNSSTTLTAIQEHYIYGTMYQNAYGQAIVAGTWLYDMLSKGCTVNPNAPFTPIPGPTRHFVNSGYMFVSQSNVGQFIGQPENIPSNTAQVLADTSEYLSCP